MQTLGTRMELHCVAPDFTSSIAKHSMVLLEAYRENRERNSFGATCGCLLRTRGAFHFNDVVYRWHIAGKLWLPNVYLTKKKWYPKSSQCCLLSHSSVPRRTSVRTCHFYLRKLLAQRNPILIILVSDLTVLEYLIMCPLHMLGEITYQQRLFFLANLERFLSPFSQISRELKSVY